MSNPEGGKIGKADLLRKIAELGAARSGFVEKHPILEADTGPRPATTDAASRAASAREREKSRAASAQAKREARSSVGILAKPTIPFEKFAGGKKAAEELRRDADRHAVPSGENS